MDKPTRAPLTLIELKIILGVKFEFERQFHKRFKKYIQEKYPAGTVVLSKNNRSNEEQLFEIQFIDLIARKMLQKGSDASCNANELDEFFSGILDYFFDGIEEDLSEKKSFDDKSSKYEEAVFQQNIKTFLMSLFKELSFTLNLGNEIESVWRDLWKICVLFKDVATEGGVPIENIAVYLEIEDEVKRKFFETKEKMLAVLQKNDPLKKMNIKKIALNLLKAMGRLDLEEGGLGDFQENKELQKILDEMELVVQRVSKEKDDFHLKEIKRIWS